MSKAFTLESDDLPERPAPPRPTSTLPPGVRNYITPSGAKRLQDELDDLVKTGSTTPRLAALQQILQTIEIAPPPAPPWDQVRFGATVKIRDSSGEDETFRIVGVDETDVDRDWISWLSPVARALMNARVGEKVKIHLPAGARELEILSVAYD